MTHAELLLAIDGDGTKTQALVTDPEGNVLARGLGPSSQLHDVGFEQFGKAVKTAIEGALINILGPRARAEGPSWRAAPIAAACFGLAGVDGPEDEAQVSRWVTEQAIARKFVIVNDSELILAAGTPEGWGVAVISGTGSICLGRSPEGRTIRVGGWGPLLGDEGSGYRVALHALLLSTQTADGRAEAPALLQGVLRHWSLPDAQALIRHVYSPTMTPAEIAGLAAVVLDLAAKGDAAAGAIVAEAARDLSLLVRTVVKKLGLKRPPLALAGGALRGTLKHALLSAVGEEISGVTSVADPSLGAVVLARRLLKAPPTR